MQCNYWYRHLVVIIDNYVHVYIYETYIFDTPILSFQAKNEFIGKSKVFQMTDISRAIDKIHFDGNIFLLECENNEYGYISRLEIQDG